MTMIAELQQKHVHLQDSVRVAEKLSAIVKAGKDRLQVVADFDNTLTKHHMGGKRCQGCHGVIGESLLMPETFRKPTKDLLAHYYPIEVDPKLSIEEKTPHMVEWWGKAHGMLVASGLQQQTIKQMVEQAHVHLRESCPHFFETLHAKDIPLLIFSAGIGDVIREFLTQCACMYDNMHIVSNFMDFDQTGKIVGFQDTPIHVFNKNEHAVHKSDYFSSLSERHHVLLLGDGIGDLQMSQEVDDPATRLTIGFLNDKIEERLEDYKAAFDIVIVDDQTMTIPNAILASILNNSV